MPMTSHRPLKAIAVVLTLVLAACGSGGGPLPDGGDVIPAEPESRESVTSEASPPPSITASPPPVTETSAPSTTNATTTSIVVPVVPLPESASPTTSNPPDSVPEDGSAALLESAFERMRSAPPARTSMSMTLSGVAEATSGELEMAFEMVQDATSGDFSVSVDFTSFLAELETEPIPAELGKMEMMQVGDVGYLQIGLFNLFLGIETPWVSVPADEMGDAGADAPIDADDADALVEAIEQNAADVEDLGVERVDGVDLRHLRVVVPAEAVGSDLDAFEEVTPQDLASDLWIDPAGNLVRLSISMDEGGATDDIEFESMVLTMRFADHGLPVEITPPPAAEVTDLEDFEGFDFDM